MPTTARRWLIVLLGIVVLCVTAATCTRGRRPLPDIPPADGAFIGQTREAILARLGAPQGRFAGHYGLPPLEWAKKYDPCETFTYEKWNGTLYLSVYPKNGQWVCFSSTWVPQGTAF